MAESTEDSTATEQTPLISNSAARVLDPGSGVAPEGPHTLIADGQDLLDASKTPTESDASAAEQQSPPPEPTEEGLPEVRKKLPVIFAAVALGVYLGSADQTLVVTSYARIGTDLHALNLTSWISTAYFLSLASFQPLYGRLSDIFGRKTCLLTAYVIFGTGCVFCGLSTTMTQLILSRAFAGIGGGGMMTVISILLSDIVPLRDRALWQSYINVIYGLGAGSGAPLGGFLADSIGWRWAFIAQGPLCMIAFLAVALTLHLPPREEADWKAKLAKIDFLGAACLVCAVFSLILALDRGGNVGWSDRSTLISIGFAVPLTAAFIYVELKVANNPVAPAHIIFNREMLPLYLCNFFAIAGWLATLFYIPLYWQAVENTSATQSGLRIVPSVICGSIGSFFAGFWLKKTGKYYLLTVVVEAFLSLGMILITLSTGLLLHSTPLIMVGLCINAFSNGTGITSTLVGMLATAGVGEQAVTVACSYLFRSIGGVIGTSIAATVANQSLRQQLAVELPALGLGRDEAIEIADRVRQSLEYLRQLDPEVRAVVAECYANGTNSAFMIQTILVFGALISSWFIVEKQLKR